MSVAPARAPIASADEEPRRRRLRMPGQGLVVAVVVAFVMAVGVPSVAFASHTETQITAACAQKSNGLLRVAASTSDCRPKQETAVSIWPGPTQLCIQPDGSVRRLTSAKACSGTKPPGTIITVPTSTPVYFCAPSSGVLRRVSGPGMCGTETAYVIVNHAPSDIGLSNASVLENEPAGTVVGTLSITDGDPASTTSFSLVTGAGGDDNGSFSIAGGTLTTAAAFDYEADTSYSIRVRASDGYGGAVEEVFTIQVTDVVEDLPPTAVDDDATVAEDATATTIDVLVNDANDDGGPITIDSVTQPDNGTVVIAGDAASVTYEPDLNTCNDPPGTTTDDFTYTLAPGDSTATVAVTVTCVDDPATAGDDAFTVAEDADATTLDVLADDADVDSGSLAVVSASDPDHGTVVLTGGSPGAHAGLTYQPDPDYCNDPPGTTTDDFTYTVTGGVTATVSLTVTCVNDAPTAGDDAFLTTDAAVGNTAFVVDAPGDGPPTASGPRKTVSGDLLADDTDADGTLTVVADTITTNDGGSVDIQADGDFVYTPVAGTSCTDASDFFDYEVTDGTDSDVGRVTIAIAGCVWYVSNNADGNSGTSTAPFDTLAQAGAAVPGGDAIFVYAGDGTTTGYDAGILVDAGQQLIGEPAPLSVLGSSLHAGGGPRPKLTATGGLDVVELRGDNRVSGLALDPSGLGGGISGANGSGGAIVDVSIVDAGTVGTGPGIDLFSWSGLTELSNLTIQVHGTGVVLDAVAQALFTGPGIVSVHAIGAPAFVATDSGLAGSRIAQVIAEDSPTGGVHLAGTTGQMQIDALDLETTGATPAFRLDHTGAVTISASGTANVVATGGPAVSVLEAAGSALALDAVTSTGSPGAAVTLTGLGAGTFSASSGTLASAGRAFEVYGGSGDVSYGGTLSDGSGPLSAWVSARTGGTVTLSGDILDGSDEGGGILVTENTGGATVLSGATKQFSTNGADVIVFTSSDGHALSLTGGGLDIDTSHGKGLFATSSGAIAVTGAGNTIDTSVGFAVNIAFTDIAAAGVTFQRVSIGGTGNIVVNGTGTAGSFNITGLGSTAQGGDGSGGVIRNPQGFAVSLMDTKSPSLRNMRIVDPLVYGVIGSRVDGFSFTYSTISGAGTPDIAGSSSIRFGGGSGADLTGAVTITDNVITGTEENGISIVNSAGTISHADISRNRISDDGTTTTPGYAISLDARGTATTAASITKATIHGNAITDFRRGGGIVVRGGNTVPGGPGGNMGNPGNPTAVIVVTGNSMDGGSGGVDAQPLAFFVGGVEGAGHGSFDVSGNGTGAAPLRHFDGVVIDLFALGQATLTTRVAGNFIDAGNAFVGAGISVVSDSDTDQPGSGVHSTEITGNTIRGTDGPGILTRIVNSNGSLTARILNNTITAPTTTSAAVAGIHVDSGSAVGLPTLCLEITGNTTAGSTNFGTGATSPGITLRRQNVGGVVFGIEGLPSSPAGTPVVENYVNGQNISASGTFGTGGTALLGSSGFTSCTAP